MFEAIFSIGQDDLKILSSVYMSESPLVMNLRKTFLAPALVMVLAHSKFSLAEDAFFHVPLTSLTFIEGALPTGSTPKMFDFQLFPVFQPYAALDGEGEVYIGGESLRPWTPPERLYSNSILAARAPKGKEVTGRLFVPKPNFSGMTILNFKLGPETEKPESKAEFLKAKEGHYQRLRDRDVPGAAWFRHQENEVLKASGTNTAGRATPVPGFNRRRRPDFGDYDSTYELFSGGRLGNIDHEVSASKTRRHFAHGDEFSPQQLFDDGVEGAVVQLDAGLFAAFAQRGGHFIGMHGPLEEQDQDREGQGVGEGAFDIRHQIYDPEYSYTSI